MSDKMRKLINLSRLVKYLLKRIIFFMKFIRLLNKQKDFMKTIMQTEYIKYKNYIFKILINLLIREEIWRK